MTLRSAQQLEGAAAAEREARHEFYCLNSCATYQAAGIFAMSAALRYLAANVGKCDVPVSAHGADVIIKYLNVIAGET